MADSKIISFFISCGEAINFFSIRFGHFFIFVSLFYLEWDKLFWNCKILNRKQGKHLEKTGETPEETVEPLEDTCGNTTGNGRKQLGNRGNTKLKESLQ